MGDRPRYSIIAPIYNEEGNIQILYDRICQVMDSTGETWELITINDGSRDRSAELIQTLAASRLAGEDGELRAELWSSNRCHCRVK